MHTALTIAGSDSGGGAGIQADLKTFAAHGVFGTSAITAVTAQNSLGIALAVALAPELVVAQIDAVVSDFGADAVKIGMLSTADIVVAVADALVRHQLTNIVLDPVMVATSGESLLDASATGLLRSRLLPLAAVVTPNTAEAAALTGLPVRTVADLRAAAARLIEYGARAAVVTGGHLDGPAIDVFYDGQTFLELTADRIDSRHTHGTGCTFSAAIAARLALGDDLVTATQSAKRYVTYAIQHAPGLGHGRGPLGHVEGRW
jgi:hydroxymethylpyrimidine/phosphomethylpyrimidine kinase